MADQHTWKGEENRPLSLYRPCACGCDERGGYKGVGYLTGSDKKGKGFTLWIEDEPVFQAVKAALDRDRQHAKIFQVAEGEKCGGCNWEVANLYFAADSQEDIDSLRKAQQAIDDCLEMGLDGVGD